MVYKGNIECWVVKICEIEFAERKYTINKEMSDSRIKA